ncbi:MAG TPA: VOC family protein [Ignavibacteriales bacterium]|nr:VOC family protein [Ignavibacteriales bacterium]
MKIISSLLLILTLTLSGCIRHSDQQLKRKTRQKAVQENVNFKKLTPNLMVNDVNETIKFYHDNLGFGADVTIPDTGKYNFAILSNGNVELMVQKRESFSQDLNVAKDAQIGGTFSLFFEVNDIVPLYEKATSAGLQMVRELHQTFYGTREFTIRDNNGYILTFSEAAQK